MCTLDKMNAIMQQKTVKHISEMPAAIARFEKDLKVFSERVGTEFPAILKLPILTQMIPPSWKKEFDAQFRNPSIEKSYEALAAQLIGIGSEERYMERRRGPDEMDVDALAADKAKRERGDEWWKYGSDGERITQEDYEGRDYTDKEYDDHAKNLEAEIAQRQGELNYLGKGKGKGKSGKGAGWKG